MNHVSGQVDKELYIELLQNEVKRLRLVNQTQELKLKVAHMEAERANQKPAQRQGAVSGMLGVTPAEAAEEKTYKPPRNLGDGPAEFPRHVPGDGGDLMAKTRADLAKGEQDAD